MAKNAKVVKRPNESDEELLKRFKKEVMRSCVLEDVKKHEYYMSKKEKLKFKHDMLMRHMKNKKYKNL